MSRPGAKRRNEFPADRITIMLGEKMDTKIKMDMANTIKQLAKQRSKSPSTSYSRIVNNALVHAFEKGYDKKLISDAKK